MLHIGLIPEVASKETLYPCVRDGESRWLDVVRWRHHAMLEAGERGICAKNIDSLKSELIDPTLRVLLGVDPGNGKALGLNEEWFYKHRQAGRDLRRRLREDCRPEFLPRHRSRESHGPILSPR